MIHLLKEIRTLREEGKLHQRLLIRTRLLCAISLVLLGIVIYNVVARDADWRLAAALALMGLPLGMFVFSRMNVVQWNEEEEVVETGRMDMLGYVTIALYIVFEISLRTFLNDFFPAHAIAYLLAAVVGTLLGRVFGSLFEIHRVYQAAHP